MTAPGQDGAPRTDASDRSLVHLPVTIDVAGWAYPVEGLGPGGRVCLWVRGCAHRCPGCISPELWASGAATAIGSVAAELAGPLAKGAALTISGGEPFDQAREVRRLIQAVRERAGDVEVLIYTGYALEDLLDEHVAGRAARRLVETADIIIDGPYMAHAGDKLRWRGSDNQRVHLLTARAQRHAAESMQSWSGPRPLRVQHIGGGQYRIAGIPRRGEVEQLRASLKNCDGVRPAGAETKED